MSAPATTHDLTRLLPPRAIIVRPPRTVEAGTAGVIALLAMALVALLATLGPGIVGDWRLRGEAAAPGVQLRDVNCRSWLGVLRFCGATVVEEAGGNGREHAVRYAFLGSSGEPSTALRSARDASRVTTDLGLQTVWSRSITLMLLAALLAAPIAIAGGVLRRGVATRRAFARMSGQRLAPVVVEMVRNNRLPPRRRLWIYVHGDDSGRPQRAMAEWPSAWQPLFTRADETQALALRGPGSGPAMLLDAELNGVELTAEEKATFLEAFRAAFGEPGGKPAAVSS